jgi:hypothetical protein
VCCIARRGAPVRILAGLHHENLLRLLVAGQFFFPGARGKRLADGIGLTPHLNLKKLLPYRWKTSLPRCPTLRASFLIVRIITGLWPSCRRTTVPRSWFTCTE